MEKKLITLVFITSFAGIGVGYGLGHIARQSQISSLQSEISGWESTYNELFDIPTNVTKIAEKMYVVIVESDTRNRTVYLDKNQSYCKVIVFPGGENPIPKDLAYPNASIVFFFLEDIEDPEKTDNYSDLIIRMNPIINEEDAKLKMCVVFFAEGGYEKLVYYQNQVLHHYRDEDPTSNYGIKHIEIDNP